MEDNGDIYAKSLIEFTQSYSLLGRQESAFASILGRGGITKLRVGGWEKLGFSCKLGHYNTAV